MCASDFGLCNFSGLRKACRFRLIPHGERLEGCMSVFVLLSGFMYIGGGLPV